MIPSKPCRPPHARPAIPRVLAPALALLGLATGAMAEVPTGNLLVNGSGAAPLSTGWTIIANGGSGWVHSAGGGYDETPGYFITSYGWCQRSQVIDLLAAGLTAGELDGDWQPVIKVSEAINSYRQPGNPDQYYIRVELRGAADQVLASWNAGTRAAPKTHDGAGWIVESTEFQSYPVGVRKIYFEDGGIDIGYWAGHYGTYHDAASVTMIPPPDRDGDGLPDAWESANGTNPDVFDRNDDPDRDGLTNWEEYQLGTHPNNPDTDGDGYLDGAEDMTGVWNGVNSTGTHPLNPDTDGDGLPDGAENPDLPFVDASQAGTNPNLQDTDGDGLPDLAEITHGSDPTDPDSTASFVFSTVLMRENFDGNALNSTYAFTQSSGAFTPAVVGSGLESNGNAARLTSLVGSSNNSIAWDAFPSLADAVRISVDFRMSEDSGGEAANGFGIGLFKTDAYGTQGPSNPAAIAGREIVWENPTTGYGFPGAVVTGFDIYSGPTEGNTVRVAGPNQPRPPLAVAVPPFQLNAGVFHRAVITAIKNGASATALFVEVIQDINGANPTPVTVARGIVVPGFDISTDAFRLIAGGRTGGLTVVTDIDNLLVTSNGLLPPVPEVVSVHLDRSAQPPAMVITWKSQSGITYKVESSSDLSAASWTTVEPSFPATGDLTTIEIPVPPGSPPKDFYRIMANP